MPNLSASDYQSLDQFRYQIRRFLHFSETAARAEGLEPQQHQIMLAIRAWDPSDGPSAGPTVGELAEHLLLKHHSAVGLIDRLVEHGLAERVRAERDRRQVRVRLTQEGIDKLHRLSNSHREELRSSGPLLVTTLSALLNRLATETP